MFLAVNIDYDSKRVHEFVSQKGWTLPIVLFSEEAADEHGIESIPLIRVLDPDGAIRQTGWRRAGSVERSGASRSTRGAKGVS